MSQQKPAAGMESKCPITSALEVFGDKWSLVILRDIFFKGKNHYREFLASPEGISTNILASRLKKLEAEGLIDKRPDEANLSSYLYTLTDKGKNLLPLLLEIVKWSARYNPQPHAGDNIIAGAPARLLERYEEDREQLIEEVLGALE
ncbi:MAG: helix-turn-helix domain-containing protein [Verrucomicrobia bacterium]|nr:helix-turn-helix domain-containing protein [Verrucomicrobiota bacterium]